MRGFPDLDESSNGLVAGPGGRFAPAAEHPGVPESVARPHVLALGHRLGHRPAFGLRQEGHQESWS